MAHEPVPRRRRLTASVATALVAASVPAGLYALRPEPRTVAIVVLAVAVLASLAYLARFASVALLMSLALVLQVFSAHWGALGVPHAVPLDRVMLVVALLALAAEVHSGRVPCRLRWRGAHFLLLLLAAYAAASALWAGTFSQSLGFYSLLDRLGFVPFTFFFTAPLVFRDRRARDVLLLCLAGLGAYLGAVAVLEGAHLGRFVLPRYIDDPTVGIHWGRARGPFTESSADGLALFGCGVAALMAYAQVSTRPARRAALAVALLCGLGTIFTLTRSVWVGAGAALAVTAPSDARLRRYAVRGAGVAGSLVLAVFVLMPSFDVSAAARSADQRPVWDRLNTNRAAVTIVERHPAFGVGWEKFVQVSADYMEQGARYPLTRADLEVHNVFLARAAELGLVGAAIWLAALGATVGHALLRPARGDRRPWRLGLLAVAADWVVVALFSPVSAPFPNTLLWLWAGITLAPYLTTARTRGRP